MSSKRLAEYEELINEHLTFQEALSACHLKAWGTLQLLLEAKLDVLPRLTLYGVLLGINDALQEAKRLSEERLDKMLDVRATLLKQRPSPDSETVS